MPEEAREAGRVMNSGTSKEGYGGDSVRLYLDAIGRVDLLTHAEEVELAKRIEAGEAAKKAMAEGEIPADAAALEVVAAEGETAKRQMIEANLRLVVSIARRYVSVPNMPLMDLVQEGNVGLMRAVEKFDWRKGFKFSTYATWWIRQGINRAIADKSRIVRIPVHMHEQLRYLAHAEYKTVEKYGYVVDKEVCRLLQINEEKLRELRAAQTTIHSVSFDQPLNDEEGSTSLGDMLPDERRSADFEKVEKSIDAAELHKHMQEAGLSEREIRILKMRLQEGMTLEAVGSEFQLTRERIRQLESIATRKLRRHLGITAEDLHRGRRPKREG